MGTITEKTVYKLMNKGSTGFEVTITDEGVDIETVNGFRVDEFITTMEELIVYLKKKYQYEDR